MGSRCAVWLVVLGLAGVGNVQAETWSPGGATPGQWYFGARVGPSPLTQSLNSNLDSATGPTLNFQGMYGVTNWLAVGLMLEWERHGIDQERPRRDLGSLDTVTLLPTVEVRPGHLGALYPYASMGLGVNVNSFSEDSSAPRVSPSNNFAFRLAAGGDYFITKTIALNTEFAWKRNDGHAEIGGVRTNDWNASSFAWLIGVRWFY